MDYYIGLDLGQQTDYTALSVIKRVMTEPQYRGVNLRTGRPVGKRPAFKEYQLQHLERFPLGTPYTAIADRVKALQDREPLQSSRQALVVDITGVGLPVFEMLKERGARSLYGISIHGGDAVTRDGKMHRVPKRDLAHALVAVIQSGKMRASSRLELWPVLLKEAQTFTVKINMATGHDSYEHWREGDHDDLLLSLALACWFAEYGHTPQVRFSRTIAL